MESKKRNILIFGAGGHTKVIIDAVEKQGVDNILGITDAAKERGTLLLGYPILGDIDILKQKEYAYVNHGIIGVGDNWTRSNLMQKILGIRPDFGFITVIHPSAVLGRGVVIGEGTFIVAGAIVNSDARIGRHCIINTNSSVDHDCVLGDFVTIAPGATIGGLTTIGAYTMISLGASVIHKRAVGEHVLVGAGAVVVQDIEDYQVVYGVPAKTMKTRDAGDRCLG